MKPFAIALFSTIFCSSLAFAQDATDNPFPAPPPPATPRIVSVQKPNDSRLLNGLRLIAIPRPGTGLVTLQLLVRSGAAEDPVGQNGRASMVAELLTKGTKTRTATQIADSIEQLGGSLGASAGYDSSSVTLSVLKSRLVTALPLFADVVQNPTFPAEELKRLRAQVLDDLSVSYREPGTLARLVAARVLFGNSAYGSPVVGTPQTLGKITQADLVALHQRDYQPTNAILIVSGDITVADATALIKKYLGAWKNSGTPPIARIVAPIPAQKRRIIVVDRPDAGQAAVIVNRLGIKQSEPNPVIPELTNDILGGGYSARLNREVRVKRGLSYGANSGLSARQDVGPLSLVTQTKNETAGEAARVLVDELAKLGEAPPTAEEFAARKSALSGDFARALETGGGLAGLVGELALYNRPLTELQTYLSHVQAVTPEQVETFAKNRLTASSANVVIVGNAAKFLPDLKTRFAGETVTVIPFAKLDLNTASLVKGGKLRARFRSCESFTG